MSGFNHRVFYVLLMLVVGLGSAIMAALNYMIARSEVFYHRPHTMSAFGAKAKYANLFTPFLEGTPK